MTVVWRMLLSLVAPASSVCECGCPRKAHGRGCTFCGCTAFQLWLR